MNHDGYAAFRPFASTDEEDIRRVHGDMIPTEIYQGDAVYVTLSRHHSAPVPLRVYRISPRGAELVYDESLRAIHMDLDLGKTLDLSLHIGSQVYRFLQLSVISHHREGSTQLFGVHWQRATLDEWLASQKERRQSQRWACDHDFLPGGTAMHPLRFHNNVYLRVLDISAGGMRIAMSRRSQFIIPGMSWRVPLFFPLAGQTELSFTVRNAYEADVAGKRMLVCHCKFEQLDYQQRETLGQYALRFAPNADVASVKRSGLAVRSVSEALTFGYVKTLDDYRQVLVLRKQAYQAVGKVRDDIAVDDMGDFYDKRARIIIAKHGHKVVGSVRLMFHGPGDSMEHESFVTMPSHFPPRNEIIAVTRVCTDALYRGSDLFFGLMKHMSLVLGQSDRRWMIGGATPKLIGMYERIGFKGCGLTYKHNGLAGEEHELIFVDTKRVLTGDGVGPRLWSELYADVLNHLVRHNRFKLSLAMSMRVWFYTLLRPMMRHLSHRRRTRRHPSGN